MDVEDPINPLADDAAKDLAELFSGAGVRGSFCMTGEKCRTLVSRGRQDVIDAFLPHCLGLHTDTHSFHPTTMELLADVDYETGCKRAYKAERRGFDSFQRAFGRAPVFWGGAGNTWSPEISDALKRLGIPAYAYALTELPGCAVHRFNDVIGLPQALSASEPEWSDAKAAPAAAQRLLDGVSAIDQPWIGVFVGHPTRLRHEKYWDWPYFSGRTPDQPEMTAPVPDAMYEQGKAGIREFLHLLGRQTQIVGVDDALQLRWQFAEPNPDESEHFRVHTAANLRSATGWPPHRVGLSAELIVSKTLALASTVKIGALPRS
jgi:hypothetical protein